MSTSTEFAILKAKAAKLQDYLEMIAEGTLCPELFPDTWDQMCPHEQAHMTALVIAKCATTGRDAPKRRHHKCDTDLAVRFYEQEFYVLSNFSSFRLTWHGFDFDTSEHAYHWTKFYDPPFDRNTKLPSIRAQVLDARSAHDALKIAQEHKDHVRADWDDIRVTVMYNIVSAKAQQHEYVRRKLLETGDRELVEDSWRDSFWGWGPDRDGLNMLGVLWMRVRAELRQELANQYQRVE